MMVVYTDASVKNYHGVGIGWHLQTEDKDNPNIHITVDKGYDSLTGGYTSEEAELLAIIRGVKEALRHGETDEIEIKCDCDPLVEKVRNRTSVNNDGYMEALYALFNAVDSWDITEIDREKNGVADSQAVYGRDQHA